MSFGFATATEILFGPGSLKGAFAAAKAQNALGKKAMLVCDVPARAQALIDELNKAGLGECTRRQLIFLPGIPYVTQSVASEPTCELVDKATQFGRNEKVDFVIAVGGGSVMDTGKAIAMLVSKLVRFFLTLRLTSWPMVESASIIWRLLDGARRS